MAGAGTRQMLYRADPFRLTFQVEAKPDGNRIVVNRPMLDLDIPVLPAKRPASWISNMRGHIVSAVHQSVW